MAKKEAVYKYNYDKMLRPISEQVGGSKAKPKAKPKPRPNQDSNMYAEPDREGPGKFFPAAKPKAKAKPSVINGLDVSRKGSQPVKKKPGKKKTGGVNMKLRGAGALGYGPNGR